jgi:phosphoglycerate dehydrogenase-like enzyme
MGIILIAQHPEDAATAAKDTTQSLAERIKAIAPNHELLISHDEKEIERCIADVEIIFGEAGRKFIPKARNLRWYQQNGAGADWIMKETRFELGSFTLTSASGVHGVPITEHIMALLLAFSRGLKPVILGQHDRIWEENRKLKRFELDGKRCLLVGIGAIGTQFAKVASAFGMEVVAVRRASGGERPEGVVKLVTVAEMDAELPQSDILVITAPLTNETYHMFDRRRLSLLRKGAYVVNIGRGAIIKEDDLIDLLRSGHIAGAGLDVFETEPLPKESPLWDMENVIVTPHYAGMTPRYHERLVEIFLDNLERYVAGRPMRNVVDWSLGY